MANQAHNLPVRAVNDASIVPAKSAYLGTLASQVDLQSIWGVLKRRWLLMLITIIAVLGIGIGYLLFIYKPVYESEAQLVVSTDRIQTATARTDEFSMLSDLVNLAKRRSVMGQISVIKSPDLLFTAVQRLGNDKLLKGYGEQIRNYGMFFPSWAIEVTSPKDSDLIIIKAKAYDRDVAADVANTIARTYLERDLGFSTDAAKQGRLYVSEELARVQRQLAQAKLQLAEFKKKTKLVTASSQIETLSGNFQALRYEKEKAQIEANAARRQVESIARELKAQGSKIDESQTLQLNPQYQQALSRLSDLNAQRAKLLQEYTPQSPEVSKIDGEIASAQQALRKVTTEVVGSKVSVRNPLITSYLQAQVQKAAAEARLQSLREVVEQRSSELEKLPDAERDLTKIQQQVDVLEQIYAMLSQKYYQLLINEKSTLQSSLFVATAQPAIAPVYTRTQLTGVALIMALVLALCVAALAERLDNKVRDNNTVTRSIGELPLSVIPNQPSLAGANVFSGEINSDSPFAEAFRILRNNILLAGTDMPLKMVSITSPGRGEGKSTVAINLAVSMALDGRRVLILDCDLRRPSIHTKLGIDKNIGFTNVVNRLIDLDKAVLSTKIDGLWVLTSGPFPGNPSEFLNSAACRETMKILKDRYDIVIVDCPPCAGLSDMQVLSTIVDGVLLVVSLDATRQDSLDNSIQTLALVNAPFLGYVTNKVAVKRLGYDYYGYPRAEE